MNCVDIPNPFFFIFSSSTPSLLYYSHIPTAIIALILSMYAFVNNKKLLTSRLLLLIAILFSVWSFFDLILWTNNDSRLIMFFWSIINLVELLISVFTLYFAYAFLEKRDAPLGFKIFIGFFLLLFVVLMPTKFNLPGINLTDCGAQQGLLLKYFYVLEAFFSLSLISYLITKIVKAPREERSKILYFSVGIILFLASFSGANILGSILEKWEILQYGLFGMPIFMGFLAYLIVKYNVFDIKLVGAQALVVALIALVGSQFFFAQNLTSNVLTGVTLVIVGGIGIALIRSVKAEVERKEELQLMADQLATANDKLRKLDNAKTEFISIASHQLRTPITAIKGFASLLLEGSYGELSEGVHGALEKVYSSAERLVNLIEDLLNVSRIESGRMTFAFESSSVEKLIKELYDNFMLIAKNKKFYLEMKMPETTLPEIMMDYSKIRELTSNFIDNALKYTEKGGVTIKAEMKDEGVVIDESGFVIEGKKSEFGKVVRITVSDTGIGIPREEIPYLFKKFSRGKDVSRLHVGGTGLGLFVGKAIAEAHHGQVWVESDGAGLGSRFIIEIPVEHVE
jgi:signal transduction histidine kinase